MPGRHQAGRCHHRNSALSEAAWPLWRAQGGIPSGWPVWRCGLPPQCLVPACCARRRNGWPPGRREWSFVGRRCGMQCGRQAHGKRVRIGGLPSACGLPASGKKTAVGRRLWLPWLGNGPSRLALGRGRLRAPHRFYPPEWRQAVFASGVCQRGWRIRPGCCRGCAAVAVRQGSAWWRGCPAGLLCREVRPR